MVVPLRPIGGYESICRLAYNFERWFESKRATRDYRRQDYDRDDRARYGPFFLNRYSTKLMHDTSECFIEDTMRFIVVSAVLSRDTLDILSQLYIIYRSCGNKIGNLRQDCLHSRNVHCGENVISGFLENLNSVFFVCWSLFVSSYFFCSILICLSGIKSNWRMSNIDFYVNNNIKYQWTRE